MKKFLLASLLTAGFVSPVFCLDSTNANNGSVNRISRNIDGIQSHRQMIDKQNKQNTKRRVTNISEEDMRVPQSSTKQAGVKNWPSKHNISMDNAKPDNSSNDDNPNLVNLASPEPVNMRDNLSISDEDRSLNRQMMMDGPQGGFQNNQPRGIGKVF